MNAKIISEQSGWLVARVWLNALNESSIKHLEKKSSKVFRSIFDACASKQWPGILEKGFGIKASKLTVQRKQ